MDQNHLITVCATVRNDQDIIAPFIQETTNILAAHFAFYEILLVDNHSTDDTVALITRLQQTLPNIRLMRLSRIHSEETAVTAALDNSIGDYVVVIEPRYDSPAQLKPLLDTAINGEHDIVIVRQNVQQRYAALDRIVAQLIYSLASRIIGQPIRVDDSRYRVYSRRVVNALAQIRRKRRYLKYFNSLIGYSQSYIDAPVTTPPHRKPVERLQAMSLIIDLVVSNSAFPLRAAALLGLGASGLSLLYVGYITIVTLTLESIVEGWLTTNLVMATMFFCLFVILTILVEYVARILDETKNEPLYFIEAESASKVAPYTRVKQAAHQINVVGSDTDHETNL